VVTSDFGLHIIKVDDIRAPKSRPFEKVKDEIAEELKSANASRRFAELAEQFSNLVYEQADSLKPAADELKLEIRQTDWLTRDAGAIAGYDSEKLRNALFSDDAVKHHRNVEAVEVARGTLVSARVLDFEAAQTLPFDTVKAQIEQQLRSQEAAKLAKARGEAVLASLAKGEGVSGTWSAATKMQRGNPELSPALVDAAFGVKASTLPAHVGAALPDGTYVALRVEKVIRPELAKDDPRVKAVAQQYERLMAERDFSALMASLRERYKVEINPSVLSPKEQ
jgi:peptidyl-prolyl cis-trans isomerase D